jgi:hypothetical protein
MVLVHDIVQLLDLLDLDGSFPFSVHGFQRGPIRTAFVDSD